MVRPSSISRDSFLESHPHGLLSWHQSGLGVRLRGTEPRRSIERRCRGVSTDRTMKGQAIGRGRYNTIEALVV